MKYCNFLGYPGLNSRRQCARLHQQHEFLILLLSSKMIRKTIYPVKNPFINFVINPNTYFGLQKTFLVSYFVYLRPAWMKATATMFPGSLDPLKLPLLYYAFPTPLKKFVKVFLILKQIPTFVFCIPIHFRIRVSAREFKVQSCKFLQH